MPDMPETRTRRRWTAAWWYVMSILLHVVIVGWWLLMPARAEREPPARPEDRVYAEATLREVAQRVDDAATQQLRQDVAALRDVQRRMQELAEQRRAELEQREADRPEQAWERAVELVEQLVDTQRRAAEAIDATAEPLEDAGEALAAAAELEPDDLTGAPELVEQAGRVLRESADGRDAARRLVREARQLQDQIADELAWTGRGDLAEQLEQTRPPQNDAASINDRARWAAERTLDRQREVLAVTGRGIDSWRGEGTNRYGQNRMRNAQRTLDEASERLVSVPDRVAEAADAQRQAAAASEALLATMRGLQAEADAADDDAPIASIEDLAEVLDATSIDADPAEPPAWNAPAEDLYAAAVRLERQLLEDYRRVRAADLAAVTGLAPASSLETVQMPIPDRPTAGALAQPASEAGDDQPAESDNASATADFYDRRQHLDAMVQQTGQMTASASQVLDRVDGTDADEQATSNTPASSTEGDANEPGSGNATGGGRAGQRLLGFMDTLPEDVPVRSGRVIGGNAGAIDGWMFLDGWYAIGPFKATHGRPEDQHFVPESVIDLDASYAGPDGRTLAWVYHRSPGPIIELPQMDSRSVYYAFTEVRVQTPGDYMIAVASDDYGELWLDDRMIWEGQYRDGPFPWPFPKGARSGDNPPTYMNHLGYVPVSLDAGVHRLLIRVINHGGGAGYTVLMRPADGESPPAS